MASTLGIIRSPLLARWRSWVIACHVGALTVPGWQEEERMMIPVNVMSCRSCAEILPHQSTSLALALVAVLPSPRLDFRKTSSRSPPGRLLLSRRASP